jgi:Ca-activated chloride channel homolog
MSRVRFTHWHVGMAVVLSLAASAAGQTSTPSLPGGQQEPKSAPATRAPVTPAPQQPNAPDGAAGPANTAPANQKPESGAPIPSEEQNAQEPPANDQSGMFVFRKQVQEVVLHATVVDERLRLVTHLDRSNFSVLEDGIPQTVKAFRREDVPVAIGIVVDNSGSMRDKRTTVNQAVMNLIRASNPQDECFVVNFTETPYLDQDFTSDVGLLQTALHQTAMGGSTALYDAIVASATHLSNNPRLDKRVLLVITDGQDNMSQETLQEAMRHLQKSNGPILYAFGLMGGALQGPGRQALQSLAEATGGAAFFPNTLDQVNDLTRAIAHDIRSQYTITYKPQNENANASYHPIHVEARAPGYSKLTVRTRNGYYTGESVR